MEPLAVFRRGGRSLHQAFDIPTLAAPLQAGVESRGMKAEGALNGGQESLPSGLGIVATRQFLPRFLVRRTGHTFSATRVIWEFREMLAFVSVRARPTFSQPHRLPADEIGCPRTALPSPSRTSRLRRGSGGHSRCSKRSTGPRSMTSTGQPRTPRTSLFGRLSESETPASPSQSKPETRTSLISMWPPSSSTGCFGTTGYRMTITW